MRARRHSSRAGTRAAAATATSTAAQATHTGHAASGAETATSVTAEQPSSFARGSSRWTRLRGSPASPVSSSAWLQQPATIGPPRRGAARRRSTAQAMP